VSDYIQQWQTLHRWQELSHANITCTSHVT